MKRLLQFSSVQLAKMTKRRPLKTRVKKGREAEVRKKRGNKATLKDDYITRNVQEVGVEAGVVAHTVEAETRMQMRGIDSTNNATEMIEGETGHMKKIKEDQDMKMIEEKKDRTKKEEDTIRGDARSTTMETAIEGKNETEIPGKTTVKGKTMDVLAMINIGTETIAEIHDL